MMTYATEHLPFFRRLIGSFFFLLFCLPLLTSCSSEKTIVNGLDEREANEILVFLSTKGVHATKVPSLEGAGAGGGSKISLWDISVPSTEAIDAMAILNQAGLPRRRGQNLLQIFTATGLVPSEMEQTIRYQAGLAEQIANTIRKIDGVIDAEVQISFPKENPLNPEENKGQKITAAVYVKHTGVLDDPNSNLISKIKRLVAASVPNLDYNNVTVIGDRARFGEGPMGGLQSATEEQKQFVSIWSIVVAKESVTAFRVIFFSMIIVILILLLLVIWTGWKLYPVLHSHGGIKELFHLHPIQIEKKAEPVKEEKTGESEKPAEKPSEEQLGLVDKDIDET